MKNKTPAEIGKWIIVHLPELIAGAALVLAVSLEDVCLKFVVCPARASLAL